MVRVTGDFIELILADGSHVAIPPSLHPSLLIRQDNVAQLLSRLEENPHRSHQWRIWLPDVFRRPDTETRFLAVMTLLPAVALPVLVFVMMWGMVYIIGKSMSASWYSSFLCSGLVAWLTLTVMWIRSRRKTGSGGKDTFGSQGTAIACLILAALLQGLLQLHLERNLLRPQSFLSWVGYDIYLLADAFTLGLFGSVVSPGEAYSDIGSVWRLGVQSLKILLAGGVLAIVYYAVRTSWRGYEQFDASASQLRNYLYGVHQAHQRSRPVEYIGPHPNGDALTGTVVPGDKLISTVDGWPPVS